MEVVVLSDRPSVPSAKEREKGAGSSGACVVKLRGVSKRFGEKLAVDALDLETTEEILDGDPVWAAPRARFTEEDDRGGEYATFCATVPTPPLRGLVCAIAERAAGRGRSSG